MSDPRKVYRIEVTCVFFKKGEMIHGSRFGHMAMAVKIGEQWFLVDCAWGGICFGGAIELEPGKITETPRMRIRCVPADEKEFSFGFSVLNNHLM